MKYIYITLLLTSCLDSNSEAGFTSPCIVRSVREAEKLPLTQKDKHIYKYKAELYKEIGSMCNK